MACRKFDILLPGCAATLRLTIHTIPHPASCGYVPMVRGGVKLEKTLEAAERRDQVFGLRLNGLIAGTGLPFQLPPVENGEAPPPVVTDRPLRLKAPRYPADGRLAHSQ